MKQIELPFTVVKSGNVDGLELGVLEDGSVYANGRSLARLCGVVPSAIIQQAAQWAQGKRDGELAKALVEAGVRSQLLYQEAKEAGRDIHAYPEIVCMVCLRYYGFKVGNPIAADNFQKLAILGLRDFVYRSLGYSPAARVPDKWRQFQDRMAINNVPQGYFSVFQEMSKLVVDAIHKGLVVDDHTVPDISVGQRWSSHWADSDGDSVYGKRIKHEHNFPDYFPQSKHNPYDAHAYPLIALGVFRIWLEDIYLPMYFPKYLERKVKLKQLSSDGMRLILGTAEEPSPLPPVVTPPKLKAKKK